MAGKKRPKTQSVNIRMPVETVERIDTLACIERRTRANMITVIAERYLSCPTCQKEKP